MVEVYQQYVGEKIEAPLTGYVLDLFNKNNRTSSTILFETKMEAPWQEYFFTLLIKIMEAHQQYV